MGGVKGCTHLTELLGPVATTAIQTLVSLDGPGEDTSVNDIKIKNAGKFLYTCFSHAENSPVVKEHWPDLYRKATKKTG